jgi:2-hydroxy-3-keto-5-methylthiopentenyl-1-phosphate phosphatase
VIPTAVFCDFDGTITQNETFVGMLKEFAPAAAEEIMPEIYALRLTLREGVKQMLASIPASCYPAILDYARTQPMRAGFVELLDFLDERQIPLVVVSGGLQGMVETVLGDLKSRVKGIHAVEIDSTGEFLTARSRYEGDTELVAKVSVIQSYQVERPIAIGDSVTDLNMALYAPIVFARDKLATYLQERQKTYYSWDNFFDIRDRLADL